MGRVLLQKQPQKLQRLNTEDHIEVMQRPRQFRQVSRDVLLRFLGAEKAPATFGTHTFGKMKRWKNPILQFLNVLNLACSLSLEFYSQKKVRWPCLPSNSQWSDRKEGRARNICLGWCCRNTVFWHHGTSSWLQNLDHDFLTSVVLLTFSTRQLFVVGDSSTGNVEG